MPLLYIMPTWYCASASPLLANASIALKVAASFALAGIEKIKRHEKAKAINFMLAPQLGILLEAHRCAAPVRSVAHEWGKWPRASPEAEDKTSYRVRAREAANVRLIPNSDREADPRKRS